MKASFFAWVHQTHPNSTCRFLYVVLSAASCISLACSHESKNLTEMLLELSYNNGTELFACVMLILDRGVTDRPSKENKASVQAAISWSTWLGHPTCMLRFITK
jgi:sulfur relay (sulfurtransferase) complex TusBCD TusD component (DsrE family)